jgi:cyanosortase A-associated protein
MPNLTWKFLQTPVLAVAFSGVALVLAKTTLAPKADKSATAAQQQTMKLPSTVPLEGYEMVESVDLEPSKDEVLGKESRAGQRYRYQNANKELKIEAHYMISDGNISRYLFVYTPVHTSNAALKMKHQPGIGYYGVLIHRDDRTQTERAYLSACVNPRGESTVTEQQFTTNLFSELSPLRIGATLLGQQPLMDRRCLWTLMSVPVQSNSASSQPAPATAEPAGASPVAAAQSPEAAYTQLEAAWADWHQWWRANYPKP